MPLPLLKNISYSALVIAAAVLGLAPFFPEPHLVEKARLLLQGDRLRPIDIFDVFFHLFPALLLILKLISEKKSKKEQ